MTVVLWILAVGLLTVLIVCVMSGGPTSVERPSDGPGVAASPSKDGATIMPNRSTSPRRRRQRDLRTRRSRSATTIVLAALVIAAAIAVVAIRRLPEPGSPTAASGPSQTVLSPPESSQPLVSDAANERGRAATAPPSTVEGAAALGSSSANTTTASEPATQAPATPAPPTVPPSRGASARSVQWGVHVYLHEVQGEADHIDAIIDYVVGLGANSVAFSFPIYTDGPRPTRVYWDLETPSPQRVADVVARAHARGLRVTLRPLIDEANIAATPGQWRGSIEPVDVDAWFESYGDAIRPFFASGADEFVIAAELRSLQDEAAWWVHLAEQARSASPWVISYTFNWDSFGEGLVPGLSSFGVDMYPPSDLGDNATVEQLTVVMVDAISAQPTPVQQALVLHEVGIPALSGVYQTPWHWGVDGGPIEQDVQAKWFAAACRAVAQSGAQGLYFWMLDSNIDPLTANPADQPPKSFIGRLAEASIRDCFAT